jgi:AraC-like DNA-binding protein
MGDAAVMYRTLSPRPPLDAWIEQLWYWQGEPRAHAWESVIAGAGTGLMVNLAEDALRYYDGPALSQPQRTRGIALAGPSTRTIAIDAFQPRIMGVQFRPGGALALFGHALHGMRDAHVALDELLGSQADALYERLLDASDPETALRRLHDALAARAVSALPTHPALSFALARIDAAPCTTRVLPLAAAAGVSQRRLIDLFTDAVGVTPKVYLRLVRFQQVLDRVWEVNAPVDWSEVAFEYGYSDQSHLNREFRALAGLTPTEYLRRPGQGARHAVLDVAEDSR